MSRSHKKITTFLIITLGLSSVFWEAIISSEEGMATSNVAGLMWCPGISALMTSLIYNRNLRELGWGWGKTRYQFLSYSIPIIYATLPYGIVWLTGLGRFTPEAPIDWGLIFTIYIVLSLLTALGEEIGWRGFLVPELYKLTNFTQTSLISGIIWAVWHCPTVLFAGYNSGTPFPYTLICMTTMVVGISFIYTWMRLKTDSVWTAMFLHGAHNLYIQEILDPLTADTGITAYITGEFGAALAIVAVITAFIFWKLRSRLPAN